MIYSESKTNLFDVGPDYYLAHCISVDAVMGQGIAKEFITRFPDIKCLRKIPICVGTCEVVGPVLNLITKTAYYNKPTYGTLREALENMKEQCQFIGIKKIAMPKIGCGLDKLSWPKVSEIIQDVFKDTDVEIVVCYL